MIIVVIIIEPGFLHPSNFIKILTQASTRGILALGVAGMIVLAGTDLSAGRILGCCAAVSASLVQATTYASRMYPEITKDLPLILPLAASILIGVAFCALNGFGVAKLNLHAFIVSLGTQTIAFGATCIYIHSQEGEHRHCLLSMEKFFELCQRIFQDRKLRTSIPDHLFCTFCNSYVGDLE